MLLILTDKSKKIGSGNFYRSMNLYKNLLRHGHKVRFIKDSNFFLSNNSSKNIIKKSKIIIIDTSLISKKNYYKLHQSNVKILCFDFFFNLPHNYNISIYEHQKIYCKNHKFIGNKYINIRSGFINLKKRKIKNKSVLISIGSGDLKNKGLKVYNYLKSKNLNVDIIKGEFSNYSNFKSLDLINSNYINFPNIINRYEYIISSGGSTLFESNYLKKKIFVIPQTKFENNIAKDFYNKKAILGYSFQHIKNYNFQDKKDIIKQIVDGNGIKRIIKIINKILCL